MSSFIAELKRRNVFKVGVAYVIVGWLLIQAADILLPTFQAPDWTMRVFTLFVLLGFPIAVFLAWAFELTPEGIKTTSSEGPDKYHTRTTGQQLNYTIIGLLSLAVVILLVNSYVPDGVKQETDSHDQLNSTTAPPAQVAGTTNADADEPAQPAYPAPVKSIAVLPFLDLSEGKDQTWFADGLAEEILNSLAQLPELLVTSRTSSFQFRGEERNPGEIASKLRVANIVEGSVRRIGDELRVTAQLIRATDGFHLWSEVYPSTTRDDLFKVQRDVAEKIAGALNIVLDDTRRERMFRSGTRNVEAFEAYQRGWSLFDQAHSMQSKITLWDANVYFDRAMELDPGYAQAALNHMDAFAHVVLGDIGFLSVKDSPYSPAEALQLLLKDLNYAVQNSPTPTFRIVAELNREIFSPTWYRIPALIEQLRKQPDFNTVTMESSVWLADILFFMDADDLSRIIVDKSRTEDPLSLVSWLYAIRFESKIGNYATARQYVGEARRALGDSQILHQLELDMARKEGNRAEAVRHLTAIAEWNATSDTEASFAALNRAILAAANGDIQTAVLYADEKESEIADTNLITLYYEMGAEERLRSLVRQIDDQPGGPTKLAFMSTGASGSRRMIFNLEDTPDFTAKLTQAGIDPASFENPLPRISGMK